MIDYFNFIEFKTFKVIYLNIIKKKIIQTFITFTNNIYLSQ